MDFTLIANIAEEHFKGVMNRIPLFLTPPRNMEPWFSGEMAVLLEICKAANIISKWWPEVRYSWNNGTKRQMCDYVLQFEGNPPSLVGLEIKAFFAARQGTRQLQDDENDGHLTVYDQTEGNGGQPWNLQDSDQCKAVAKDARRLSRETGLEDRYCLVFAYGKNGELQDADIDEFEEKLGTFCAEDEPQEVVHVELKHNKKIAICGQTVLHILTFCVSSQDDVDNNQ